MKLKMLSAIIFVVMFQISLISLENYTKSNLDHGKIILSGISKSISCNGSGFGYTNIDCKDVYEFYLLYEDGYVDNCSKKGI